VKLTTTETRQIYNDPKIQAVVNRLIYDAAIFQVIKFTLIINMHVKKNNGGRGGLPLFHRARVFSNIVNKFRFATTIEFLIFHSIRGHV
jgi:hypothetical protein